MNKEKIPKHEQDYWDTWANVLPFPQGVVHDAESYKKAVKEKQEEKKK